jgi:hypothetical protein
MFLVRKGVNSSWLTMLNFISLKEEEEKDY